jgi:hypothetical protein
MPIREPIVQNIVPKEVEKPIPVRVLGQTRTKSENTNQPVTNVVNPPAESGQAAESVRLSPQLTALARKEQAYRHREQALKAREKELELKLLDADKYSQLKDKLNSKDYSEAEALGLDYDAYVQYKLNQANGEDPNAQALKKLENEIEALKKAKEENAVEEYEETVAAYKSEIMKLVESDPAFSKIKKSGKQDAVLQLIIDSWEEDDLEMSVGQACKDVESYLGEEAKKWASLVDEPKVSGGAGPGPLPPPRLGSRTLTQQMQPAGVMPQAAKSLQHLSESERYAEARRRVLERRQQGR